MPTTLTRDEINAGLLDYLGEMPALGLADSVRTSAASSDAQTQEGRLYYWLAVHRDAQSTLDDQAVAEFEVTASDNQWAAMVAWHLFRRQTDDLNEAVEAVESGAESLIALRKAGLRPIEAVEIAEARIDGRGSM